MVAAIDNDFSSRTEFDPYEPSLDILARHEPSGKGLAVMQRANVPLGIELQSASWGVSSPNRREWGGAKGQCHPAKEAQQSCSSQ